MQPKTKLLADRTNLKKVVKGTGGCCAQGGNHTEGNQSTFPIFLCCSFDRFSSKTEVVIRLKKLHPDSSKQASSLDTGVGLL